MKEKVIFLILSTSLIISCAAQNKQQIPLTAQEICEAPSIKEGDSWKFITGGGEQWEETIIKRNNELDLRQTPNKGFPAFLNFPFVGRKIFPLWVGKKYGGVQTAQSLGGIDLNYFYSYRILDIVNERVEGGTFRCYKIELRVFYSSEEGIAYLFYSPKTKSIIKVEIGPGLLLKWASYELSAFSLKE